MRGNKFLKLVDRYIGIPIVLLLGVIKKKNVFKQGSDIGVLMTAAIGDTLIASSVIEELKSKSPEVSCTLYCTKELVPFAKLTNIFDKIIEINLKDPVTSIRVLRSTNHDILIDCGQWARINSIFIFFAKASFKIGFNTHNQYRHFIYDRTVMHSSSKHELENYRNLFSFSAVPYSAIPKLMSSLVINNKYIVFHICPSGEKSYLKEWPVKNWVELGLYLNNLGFEIVMTGSKDDFYSNQKVSQKLTSSVNLAGETNFEELVPYLNCAEMVVSVNTGVLHIAAATDTKVISINGPTSVKRWGALGENSMNLVSDLSCSPCLNLGFEYGCNENNCMKSISVENVKEAIHKLLG